MAADERTERVFRHFEETVLDQHHNTFPFRNRDRAVATYAALAQFDCYAIISLFLPQAIGGVGIPQVVKSTEEGLSQGLRWLHDGTRQFDLLATGDKDAIDEAGEYCAFAAKYVDIADFHKMYGRGQVEIEVDEQQRRVRFITPPSRPPAAALVALAEQAYRLRSLRLRNPAVMAPTGRAVHEAVTAAKYHYHDGRIVLDDEEVVNTDALRELLARGLPKESVLLEGDADLLGFSIQEFGDYFEALRRWSFCCTALFLSSVLENGKQQWECVPTQVLERGRFLETMSKLSSLPEDKVETITARLTYDNRTVAPDVFQQPLFCGPTSVAWSVQVVQSSKYLRNMLKLMSRTKSLQKYTATLIGGRERAMLRELGQLLSSHGGTSYKLITHLKKDGKEGEVDLLAYNHRFGDEILLIEGKAALGVDEINEVDALTKQMQEGQQEF